LSYFETSAATGQNVNIAVELLLEKVMLRMDQAVEDAFGTGQRGTIQLKVYFISFKLLPIHHSFVINH
jgi:hypothetical protein